MNESISKLISRIVNNHQQDTPYPSLVFAWILQDMQVCANKPRVNVKRCKDGRFTGVLNWQHCSTISKKCQSMFIAREQCFFDLFRMIFRKLKRSLNDWKIFKRFCSRICKYEPFRNGRIQNINIKMNNSDDDDDDDDQQAKDDSDDEETLRGDVIKQLENHTYNSDSANTPNPFQDLYFKKRQRKIAKKNAMIFKFADLK